MSTRNYTPLYPNSDNEANMLQDADNAITECNLWDWLKEFNPGNEGFSFSKHPNLNLITSKMKLYDAHSGSSFAWTLRQMEYVAKNGFNDFSLLRKAHIIYYETEEFHSIERLIDEATIPDEIRRLSNLIEKGVMRVYNDLKDDTIEKRFPYTCHCRKSKGLRGWCGVAGGGVPGCEH